MNLETGEVVGAFLNWDAHHVTWLGWANLVNLDSRPTQEVRAFHRTWHELVLCDSGESVWGCEVAFRSRESSINTLLNAKMVYKLDWNTFAEYRRYDKYQVNSIHDLPSKKIDPKEILELAP